MTPRLAPPTLGLTLAFLAAATGALAATDAPTYSRDVAPIFFAKCASCHRPGEIAPMSLLSYREARPWARSIARQVQNRDMPPWSGESERRHWRNDLSLSDEEIATVIAWAKAGAPEGDAADLPEVPTFAEGWTLGEPDYVLTLERIDVPADGEDLFPKFSRRIVLDEPRWVRAIEFQPGDRRVTHHFLSTYVTNAGGKQKAGAFAIWTAGMPPYVFPDGTGRVLGEETVINFDNHYHPMGEATSDVSKVGLYFGEGPLQKEVATVPVTNTGLRIPPGAGHHAETAHFIFDRDSQILAFSPHMHVRGKAMSYEITYPDGTREMLLDVPKYDYNWQWLYYPTEPIDVPAGSRIDVTAVWDNSADNPANPDPTQEIIYRGDTFSEMFNGFMEVIPKEGVYFEFGDTRRNLLRRLALHPAEDSFLVGGFLQLAFHAPREGEGWLYLPDFYSISLDDISWQGDELTITTQFPTLSASATTTLIQGSVGEDGRFRGKLVIGADTESPQEMAIVGQPVTGEALASSAGR